jgi:beta-aspartyl-peptidase (threonine type)
VVRPTLIIHGGAGVRCAELASAQRAGCERALHLGWRVLSDGGAALDAVCAAVAEMEDDPHFNAGTGSVLNADGEVEMDATVMDGNGLRVGAVGAVRRLRNPVRAARAVLEDGRHALLVGAAADAFAADRGVRVCEPGDLVTPRQRARWSARRLECPGATVGAVAVDREGHVAAATSTGGLAGKRPGRVGDSAIIGAGTYATDACGAASTTGAGEAILRVVLAYSVIQLLRDGLHPAIAADAGIRCLAERTGAGAGIIVVDTLGRVGMAHNTPHLVSAYIHTGLGAPCIET